MTGSTVRVNLFFVFIVATKRAFALLHAMLAGSRTHQTVFVDSCFHLQPFPKLLQLHVINITRIRRKVKRQCGTQAESYSQWGVPIWRCGGPRGCQAKKPSREREGFGLEDMKLGPLYMVARGLYLLLRFKLQQSWAMSFAVSSSSTDRC